MAHTNERAALSQTFASLLMAFAFLLAACTEPGQMSTSPEPRPLPPVQGGTGLPPSPTAPSPQAPQDWLTYVNDEFGLALDHPPSLSVEESRRDDGSTLLLNVRLLGPEESDPLLRERSPGRFALDLYANPNLLEPRDWLDAHGWPSGTGPGSATSTEIDGHPALEITSGRMVAPNRFIYLSAKGVIIRLVPIGPDSDLILASFRFL